MVKVKINGVAKEYDDNITYGELAKANKDICDYDIILARCGGKLMELNKRISQDCEVVFLDTSYDSGHKTYIRGVTLLMLKAFYDIAGESLKNIFVKYAIGDSIYCETEGIELTDKLLCNVQERMELLVERDLPIGKRSIDTEDAISIFEDYGMYDKKELFEYRRVSKVNIYTLDGFEDYYYGYMPASTGILKYFSLQLYDKGFVINMPNRKTPDKLNGYKPSPKLFNTLQESCDWGKIAGADTVGALNKVISQGRITDLILVQEAFQEKKIAKIAENIVSDKGKKFIMIAGPSSSGKTSFSHRLSVQLQTFGIRPQLISLDNYFKDRKDTPKDENGNYDFECLGAIDIELFNKDMVTMLNGGTAELPEFNFLKGEREYKGNFMKLGKDDIFIIEGIHGLNDKLSYSLPKESKFKIYISALAQLNIDEHNRISTTDGRLIRRMIRDARTRGTEAAKTISMWPSVRRGEDRYIFPFQEEADIMFNSSLIYELAVLKPYAEGLLFGIPKDVPEYIEAKRLLKFLDYFIGINSNDIPKISLLREFVGGSIFNV
ncbi:MAG: nucleoside kinase [Lachnospiraceae bacterium]